MSNDGRYLHLEDDLNVAEYRHLLGRASKPCKPAWVAARYHANAENRAQVLRNSTAKHLRRVARAAEAYATALETGRDLDATAAQLALATEDLHHSNLMQKQSRP